MSKIKVYLDNGATTRVDPKVVKAMLPYFTEKYGNASSLYKLGEEAKEALENSRKIIAKKINATPEEIIFTSGGTESDNLAIKGIAEANEGNHIITTQIEHPAVLSSCKELEKKGYNITYLPVNHEGFINLEDLKREITKDTVLVSIIHGNNEIGTIQDIKEIGKICKENNVIFHTDAVQSFAKIKINVKDADSISMNSHKIHGPKGVGALYVKDGINITNLFDGGPQEFKKRAGTENIPGIVGFAEAVKIYNNEAISKMTKLRDKLIKGLKIPKTHLNGPKKNRLCNNVNVFFEAIEGEALVLRLNDKGIAASTGSACSTRSLEPSHVLLAIGLKPEEAHGSLRLTLSRFTKKEEIDYTLKVLPKVVEELRKISPFWKK